MKLTNYINKRAEINLKNGFYYVGIISDAGDNFIELVDRKNKLVSINESEILFIREISNA